MRGGPSVACEEMVPRRCALEGDPGGLTGEGRVILRVAACAGEEGEGGIRAVIAEGGQAVWREQVFFAACE